MTKRKLNAVRRKAQALIEAALQDGYALGRMAYDDCLLGVLAGNHRRSFSDLLSFDNPAEATLRKAAKVLNITVNEASTLEAGYEGFVIGSRDPELYELGAELRGQYYVPGRWFQNMGDLPVMTVLPEYADLVK